jgi:hypothetical protein
MPGETNVIKLERIRTSLGARACKLIGAEMQRQAREGWRRKTAEEIIEEAITFPCEAMARKFACT